jgi:Tfp pilus assembly protein PilF
MADMLYGIGDLDHALNAYELALRQQPNMPEALRGAAMVYQRNNDHATAARYLRTILRHDPGNAEVWMNLGDVAVFQGDELFARECYSRAAEIDPGAAAVVEEARKRLALMEQVSRSYERDGG